MHSNRILRNIFSNWTSYVVTAVVGFVLAPVVIHSLGNTGYGLWTLVLSLTGYFGLLDLGIRSSVGRFVMRYLALDDDRNVNRVASTAFVILACGGILAFLATLVVTIFFFDYFRVDPEYASSGRLALLISGINMSLILPLGVFSAVLFALERFDVVSGITIVGELTRAALVVWSLRHGYGIVTLAIISLAMTFLQYVPMAFFARTLHPALAIRVRSIDWVASRDLLTFSAYRFIWIVAGQLIFYSDSVVIGIFLGAGAITPYAIAGSLINYGRNVVSLATDTLGPSAARMDAKADLAGLQRLWILGTTVALVIGMPVCLGLVFLGRQFITLWMGPAYAGSAVILIVLTIPQFTSMPQYASAFVLAGMAKHRPLAYFALAEGVANIVLSVILVQKFGLIGVAWGTVIPHLISTTIVVPWYTLRVLDMRVADYLVGGFLRPVLCAVPVIALGYFFSRLDATSWLTFAAEAVSMCAVFWGLSFFVCLDARQRASIVEKLAPMRHREAVAHEA